MNATKTKRSSNSYIRVSIAESEIVEDILEVIEDHATITEQESLPDSEGKTRKLHTITLSTKARKQLTNVIAKHIGSFVNDVLAAQNNDFRNALFNAIDKQSEKNFNIARKIVGTEVGDKYVWDT